jgi:hypothetical protein
VLSKFRFSKAGTIQQQKPPLRIQSPKEKSTEGRDASSKEAYLKI